MLSERSGPLGVAAISVVALAVAYIGQHGYGLAPCTLCVWQRYPWVVALALGAGAVAVPPRLRTWLTGAASLALLAGAGLAGFHVGVEQGWWPGLPGCAGPAITADMTPAELREALEARRSAVPCDEPAVTVLGVSMAGYNFLLSLGAALLAGVWATTRGAGRGRA